MGDAPSEKSIPKSLARDGLASGDAESIYDAAVNGADMEKMQEAIISTGDPEYAYLFARDVPGADIKRMQDVVIAAGDAGHMYNFANYIPGADIPALSQAILDTGDVTYSALIVR